MLQEGQGRLARMTLIVAMTAATLLTRTPRGRGLLMLLLLLHLLRIVRSDEHGARRQELVLCE